MFETTVDTAIAMSNEPAHANYVAVRIMGLSVCTALLWLVQKRMSRAQLSYTLGFTWSFGFFLGIIVTIIPDILFPLAALVGTKLPSNLVFIGAILFLTIITFMLSLKSVQQSRAILRLVQEVGILREALARKAPPERDHN